jgi:hypothetical protein
MKGGAELLVLQPALLNEIEQRKLNRGKSRRTKDARLSSGLVKGRIRTSSMDRSGFLY